VTGPFYGQFLSNTFDTPRSRDESCRSEWCCWMTLFEKSSIQALTYGTKYSRILTEPYNYDMTMERPGLLVRLSEQVYLMPCCSRVQDTSAMMQGSITKLAPL